ncbi:MAG TPA: hypothetical protein VFY85_01635 [Gemmatimonadaceae bacterium]|nr:hypothetical protein [Gemmatimonadaceae bacterium]
MAFAITPQWSVAQGRASRCTDGIATRGASVRPRHYVFLNRDRQRIADSAFLRTAALEGAQVKYTWRELEPEQDRYDLSAIQHDLEYLNAHGKRLFIQLQDVSFDAQIVNTPDYLQRDSVYHGGIARQLAVGSDSIVHAGGWMARRWDPAVQARWRRLVDTLGRAFDGKIEGIVLPETSIDVTPDTARWPAGFSPQRYRNAVIENMAALKHAFPRSVTMQYGNFMPGEWLPADDHGHLKSVYAAAARLGAAMGGPDLLPHQRGHMLHAYPLLHEHARAGVTGIAVQEGNYERVDPCTGRRPSIAELIDFARWKLGVRYVFWSTEEPYYSRDVLPYLAREHVRAAP